MKLRNIFKRMEEFGWKLDDFRWTLDLHQSTFDKVSDEKEIESDLIKYASEFTSDFIRAVKELDTEKEIVIKGHRTIKKEYDLYELYTDFLHNFQDMRRDVPNVVELVRDNYSYIFERIKSGEYGLYEFETLAKKIINGE